MKIKPNNVKVGCSACAASLDSTINSTIKLDESKGLKTQSSKIVSIINHRRPVSNSKVRGLF